MRVIAPAQIGGMEHAAAFIRFIRDVTAYESKVTELKAAYDNAVEQIELLNKMYEGVDLINGAAERASQTENAVANKLVEAQRLFDESQAAMVAAEIQTKNATRIESIAKSRLVEVEKREKAVAEELSKLAAEKVKFDEHKKNELATIANERAQLQSKIDAAKALLG